MFRHLKSVLESASPGSNYDEKAYGKLRKIEQKIRGENPKENYSRKVLNIADRLAMLSDSLDPDFSLLRDRFLIQTLTHPCFYDLFKSFISRPVNILIPVMEWYFKQGFSSGFSIDHLLSALSSPHFRKWVSSVFLYRKNPALVFSLLNDWLLLGSSASSYLPEMVEFLSGGDCTRTLEMYSAHPEELESILHKVLLLQFYYPEESRARRFVSKYINSPGFVVWIDFCSERFIENPEDRKKYRASLYLISYLFAVVHKGHDCAEFLLFFRELTGRSEEENLLNRIKAGKRQQLEGIVLLLDIQAGYRNITISRKMLSLFLRFSGYNEIKREVFKLIREGFFHPELPPERQNSYLDFFHTDIFRRFIKETEKTDPDLLFMMVETAVFSLRYREGEKFKSIREENLYQNIMKLDQRDRIFNNYRKVYLYIAGNYRSAVLRNRLLVFFYFHFSQNNRAQILFMNDLHSRFTGVLEQRNLQTHPYKGSRKKEEERKHLLRVVTGHLSGKEMEDQILSLVPAYNKDPDMERAVEILRTFLLRDLYRGHEALLAKPRTIASMKYLFKLAHTYLLEDDLFESLSRIIPLGLLEDYEEFIRFRFTDDPFNVHLYFQKGAFFALYFRDYRKEILGALFPVTRFIPIMEDDWACTDREVIFLPFQISEFPDSVRRTELHENRNYSLFVYLGLHEYSHWFSGSFEYDFYAWFLKQTLHPQTVKEIFNIIEDYRAERVFAEGSLPDTYRELFFAARKFYKVGFPAGSTLNRFLAVMMSETVLEGSLEDEIPYKRDEILDFKAVPLVSELLKEKSLSSYGSLLAYCVNSIKSMDVTSSLNAIYLAVEIYQLLLEEFSFSEAVDSFDYGRGHGSSPESPLPDGEKGDSDSAEGKHSDSGGVDGAREDPEGAEGASGKPSGRDKDSGNESDSKSSNKENYYRTLREREEDFQHPEKIARAERTRQDRAAGQAMQKGLVPRHREPDINPGHRRPRPPQKRVSTHKKEDRHVYSFDREVNGYTSLRSVEEFPIVGESQEFRKLLSPYTSIISNLQEELQYIIPRNESLRSLSSVEGGLDMDQLITMLAGRKKGSLPEIYSRNIPAELSSMAVYIGLDVSGSTDQELPSDREKNLTILDVERIFAYLLGKSLEALTPHVRYFAFNSVSGTNVYTMEHAENLGRLESDSGNRDGDFIRYINNRLEREPSKVKYFFLLSDGYPMAEGYEGDAAVEDTLMAMKESGNRGIQLIYLNIDSSAGEYYRRFRDAAAFAENFSDPEQLLDFVRPMVEKLVQGLLSV